MAITSHFIQTILKSLKNELGYELPRVEIFSDLSGRVRGDFHYPHTHGDELFRFDHIKDIAVAYMDWRKKTGGASHVRMGEADRRDGGC